MEFRIKKDYTTRYNDPIVLKKGDIVELGEEETQEKWKGWIWAEHNSQSGWIPMQIAEKIPGSKGKITKNYTARELDVKKGEKVIVKEELNGWYWVMNSGKDEGWIPAEVAVPHENHLGRISLITAIGGLALSEILIRTGVADGHVMEIINTGFEGATVGALADWFAVSALFREIPIPYVRRHTNIIVRNRAKISEGVVDLVTNRWLSPDIIKEKLSERDISSDVLNHLTKPGNIDKITDFIRKEVLTRISSGLDTPDLSGFISNFLKEQISKADYAKPLGTWLKSYVETGSHHELINKILQMVQRSLNDGDTLEAVRSKIAELIEEYKSEGLFKNLGISVAEFLNIVDREVISGKIIDGINKFIEELNENANHPVRKKLDNSLMAFAEGLISGEKSSLEIADNIRNKLLDNTKLGEFINDLLKKTKTALDEQLVSNDTQLMKLVAKNLEKAVSEFSASAESQKKFNNWVKETAVELINTHHPKIGEMVRESLWKLDDRALVDQIEGKVGNDLQFIRLNGAVIGFFAGAVIKIIKLLF